MSKSRVGVSTDNEIIQLGGISTPIEYTPEAIDEYLVLVNLPEDWEEVHNYIINENEIDGIPNRRIDCTNEKKFSLRGAIYTMSVEEAELLATHAKVESVELNPDKYPQPASIHINRFKKNIPFNKSLMVADMDGEIIQYKDGLHSNWALTFMEDPERFPVPYSGVGIGSTTVKMTDTKYSLTGKGVDAVVIDTGTGTLHPEFISDEGVFRNRDVILDGPYYVDPEYFNSNGFTYTKVLSGHTLGVGIATDKAKEWWTDATKRSAKFQSLGTISFTISTSYTYGHAVATDQHTTDALPITDSHGTSCSAHVGGRQFGLAKNANLWSIRVNLGDGAPISAVSALDFCTLWHQAKKVSQAGDVNPTIINNSWGFTSQTQNNLGVTYNIHYRGSNSTYTGNGQAFNPPAGSDGFRQHAMFTFRTKFDNNTFANAYSGQGQFNSTSATSANSAAENAINAGCIVVAALGNDNNKYADKDDVDFNNWFQSSSNFTQRCGNVDKGFSGDHDIGKGSIRIGALDCAVEPASDLQGAGAYKIRKVCYSASGPMTDIFVPAEMTMSASYKPTASYSPGSVDFPRPNNNDGTVAGTYYDQLFNGTSAASPIAVGLMCLYLEQNRKASNQDVRNWLTTEACKTGLISDPYPGINDTGYWSQARDDTFDGCPQTGDSRNVRGNGSLRGAPNRVAFNPYATNKTPKFSGVKTNGIRFQQS